MGEFGRRVLAPVAVPIVAFGFVGIMVLAVSRILLAVPEVGSTTIALLIAAEILGVASVLAAARRIKPVQRGVLIVVGLALIAGGAASASIGIREIEKHGEEVVITAKDTAFDTQQLLFPADQKLELRLVNNDGGIEHNVAIYEDESAATPLFVGEKFPGVATMGYSIEPLAAGRYFFLCTVHPTQMTGTVVVGEGGGPEPSPVASPSPAVPGATAARAEASITASGLQFDTAAFELRAAAEVSIEFDNRDLDQHNVAIYRDASGAEVIFRGEIFQGPATRTYTFEAPAAGAYYFRCDVHPQMNGTVTFRGA